MKAGLYRIIFLFFITVTVYDTRAQTGCTVPPTLAQYYEDDINALSVQYMITATGDSDQVFISQIYHDEIAGGMAAIFNSGLPERDSVFNLYCIHYPYLVSLCKEWLIFFDPIYPWTAAWQNTQTVTGNPQVDNLFALHSLYVDQYFNWGIGDAVLVKTTNNSSLNYDALADSLVLIAGINSCEPNALIGTAGYITYSKINDIRHYEFTFEWNDCFDGCDNSHTWKFDVDTGCNVTFTGSSDWWVFGYQPLPSPPGNCITTGIGDSGSNSDFKVYPNPFLNIIRIECASYHNAELKIYDVAGRELTNEKLMSEHTDADMSRLSPGIYFYRLLKDKQHISSGKIIKQ